MKQIAKCDSSRAVKDLGRLRSDCWYINTPFATQVSCPDPMSRVQALMASTLVGLQKEVLPKLVEPIGQRAAAAKVVETAVVQVQA